MINTIINCLAFFISLSIIAYINRRTILKRIKQLKQKNIERKKKKKQKNTYNFSGMYKF